MATLQFPLENAEDYNGWITFRFYKIQLDASVSGPFTNSFSNIFENIFDIGSVEQGVDDRRAARNRASDGPTNSVTVSRDVKQLQNTVRLYLPPALIFNDGINYDNNVDLGAIGGAVNRALTTGQGGTITGDQVMSAVGSSFRSVRDILSGTRVSGDAARIAAMRAAQFAPGETVSNVVSNALRIAPNPNRRTLFRNVRPRDFTFQFKMIANSPAEARSIERIIREFREQMYPDATKPTDQEGLLAGDFIAYDYPNMVEIELTYNNQRVGNLIQRGYIGTLQTVYNPSSMGYHIDGKPSEVDVTLTFFEERTLDRRDIKVGY